MTTRRIEVFDDDYTGKEIPDGQHQPVRIEIGGAIVELDMDARSPAFQSLQKFYAKGRRARGGGKVRSINSAPSARTNRVVNAATRATARAWAKANGATMLNEHGRLSPAVIEAYQKNDPDLIPTKYRPAATANAVTLDMTEGKRTRAKRVAGKATPRFVEARVG